MDTEVGGVICCSNKECLIPKLYSQGQRNKVTVPLGCPPGYKVTGIWHSHPGAGDRAHLSSTDIANLRKAKIPLGCVSDAHRTRCFRIK